MDNVAAATELTAATWEQFVGAALRRAHCQRLLAAARRHRCRRPYTAAHPDRSMNLLRMLLISAAGYWLLRL